MTSDNVGSGLMTMMDGGRCLGLGNQLAYAWPRAGVAALFLYVLLLFLFGFWGGPQRTWWTALAERAEENSRQQCTLDLSSGGGFNDHPPPMSTPIKKGLKGLGFSLFKAAIGGRFRGRDGGGHVVGGNNGNNADFFTHSDENQYGVYEERGVEDKEGVSFEWLSWCAGVALFASGLRSVVGLFFADTKQRPALYCTMICGLVSSTAHFLLAASPTTMDRRHHSLSSASSSFSSSSSQLAYGRDGWGLPVFESCFGGRRVHAARFAEWIPMAPFIMASWFEI